MDSPPQSWRELLRMLTEHPAERQRVADELGVAPYTITRWVTRVSEPRLRFLRRLPEIFPGHQQVFTELIEAEISPHIPLQPQSTPDNSTLDVPVEYLIRTLSAYAKSTGPFRTWSLCSLAVQQALVQLDPDQLGMEISVVQCVPPASEQPVRSLCERIAVGTSPWNTKVEQRLRFLGAESLAGWTVGRGEPEIVQHLDLQPQVFAVQPDAHEKSAVAWPIQREGHLAGCLQIVSTQQSYFTPEHLAAIELHANALALAFRDGDFYPVSEINLQVMPYLSTQEECTSITRFRERIMQARSQHETRLSQNEAEILILQQMEASLLCGEDDIAT